MFYYQLFCDISFYTHIIFAAVNIAAIIFLSACGYLVIPARDQHYHIRQSEFKDLTPNNHHEADKETIFLDFGSLHRGLRHLLRRLGRLCVFGRIYPDDHQENTSDKQFG